MQTSLEDVVLFNNSSSLLAIQIVHYCVLCGILGNYLKYTLHSKFWNEQTLNISQGVLQEAQKSKNIAACFLFGCESEIHTHVERKAKSNFDQIWSDFKW